MFLNKLLKSICILVVAGSSVSIKAQSEAPAQTLSKYVDPFTGDFKYNVPLMVLSGPNGEKFPLTLNYSGGIRTNQDASWVGLGWDLNIGEIRRQVKGMPDDYRNVNFRRDIMHFLSPVWTRATESSYFGPLYFNKIYDDTPLGIDVEKKLDNYLSNRNMPEGELPFEFPDYDAYYVSGPGVGGEIRPFLFDFAEYPAYPNYADSGNYMTYYTREAANWGVNRADFTRKPIFRFVNEPMAQLEPKGINFTSYQTTENDPYNPIDPHFYTYFPQPNNGGGPWDNNWYNRNNDVNVYDAANYIEYFTNEQIDKHYDVAGNEIDGFLDYELVPGVSDRNLTTKYEPDGIGAFRVTTPNGMTYHYSLPVYMRDEKITSFDLNNWSSLIFNPTRFIKNTKYAYTWKLTAITDYRYEDSNGNNYPDEEDKGFWIDIKYAKWSGNYNFRSPYFGYNADASSKRLPVSSGSGFLYSKQGSLAEGNSELYYPEYIKTSTQTVYFIKGVRNDNHSVADASGNYTPKMYLKQVILMDNDDVADNNIFSTSQPVSNDAYGTGLSVVANTSNILSEEDYSYYQTDIDAYALKTVKFDYDYHLAQKLYNNINNTFTETNVDFGYTAAAVAIYKNGVFYTTTDPIQSGKLTLNKITSFELNHEQVSPEIVFEYNSNNPDFNHQRHDIYGFHKENYDATVKSRYITTDNDKVDAWSLTKIITPLGGEININYESDTYTSVAYDGKNGMPYKPTRMFGISYVNTHDHENLSAIRFSEISVDDDDVNYYYSQATNTQTYFEYSVPNNCECQGFYYNPNFNLVLTPGSGTTPNKFTTSASYESICWGPNNHCDGSLNSTTHPDFKKGFILMDLNEVYGGGLRVKNISLTAPSTANSYQLSYQYEDGSVTTEPDVFDRRIKMESNGMRTITKSRGPVDRLAMSPNVGYAKVKVIIGDENDNIGSTEYVYKNMDPFSISISPGKVYFDDFLPNPYKYYVNYKHYVIRENKSLYGRLVSITNLDNEDNIVSSTSYEFGDGITDPRGKVTELFYDFLKLDKNSYDVFYQRTFVKTVVNPHLRKETFFKDGITTSIEYADRDNYTGIPNKIITRTPTLSSEKITKMAYQSSALMGAKTTNITNKNLLTPSREEIIKTAPQFNVVSREMGGSSSNWSNSLLTRQWDATSSKYISTTINNSVWSPTEIFTFNYVSNALSWKKVSNNTLFGGKNGEAVVEQKDMKDGYTALKFGYDDRFKIAEVSNCNYNSFTYSGFESLKEVATGVNHFDGEIDPVNGVQSAGTATVTPHTGNYMVKVPSSQFGPTYHATVDNVTVGNETFEKGIQVDRTYIASVWVHKDSPNEAQLVFSLNGNVTIYKSIRKDNSEALQIGDWIQLNLTFTVPQNYVSGTGNNDFRVYLNNTGTTDAYFDDFVVHPVDAQFSGYVYDERLGLVKAVISNDNFYTRFEHDNTGSVIATYKETKNGEKVIATTDYNFK